MALKRYSDRELRLFLWVVLPYTILMNLIVFKNCMYASLHNMLLCTGLSVVYLFIAYFLFGLTGSFIQRKFPSNQDLFKRIGIMLPVFYGMNVLLVVGLYFYYDMLHLFKCPAQTDNFWWALAFGCFASTVITFLNEAAVNWSKWKEAVTETEQLKTVYQKSKLYGLKGQINPHFLFNCFNSLSSLIQDDEQNAERFLAEMAKVHRYMLRTDDEQLVSLEQELKFARSYLFLLKVRFAQAISISIKVDPAILEKQLPPLSLQVILENIIYTNAAIKSSPLSLFIYNEKNKLIIQNSLQNKILSNEAYLEEGLDNLIAKYRLLGGMEINVQESAFERTIILPLFDNIEVAL
ncbi:MAG: histidine kinase [Chitinophagaceae bacterium]|nr:histidine kinase [Chitinophagaceae bacterium]